MRKIGALTGMVDIGSNIRTEQPQSAESSTSARAESARQRAPNIVKIPTENGSRHRNVNLRLWLVSPEIPTLTRSLSPEPLQSLKASRPTDGQKGPQVAGPRMANHRNNRFRRLSNQTRCLICRRLDFPRASGEYSDRLQRAVVPAESLCCSFPLVCTFQPHPKRMSQEAERRAQRWTGLSRGLPPRNASLCRRTALCLNHLPGP
ncbi:hypothetical protein B0T16DRAFT_45961 [Cercophora newfieldiana]|uniref:Uncharacterized protein n=1 Tax=Cercophora newfieldiana TaxID=92897 RepID=A0AA40CZ01_9PEZI|nr:hypothetical protein B0T16DRAFT_45961 [Cercophora newfieldiana]